MIAPVVVTTPIAAPLVSPAAERSDDVLGQAQSHINAGRLNQAAALLEDGVKQEPQRSDLRLKLMEVYGQQGDRDAFVGQERQLVANGDNFAQVEKLKSRFPAMAWWLPVVSPQPPLLPNWTRNTSRICCSTSRKPGAGRASAFDDDLDSAFD